jgi:hypothetical protein
MHGSLNGSERRKAVVYALTTNKSGGLGKKRLALEAFLLIKQVDKKLQGILSLHGR